MLYPIKEDSVCGPGDPRKMQCLLVYELFGGGLSRIACEAGPTNRTFTISNAVRQLGRGHTWAYLNPIKSKNG